MTTISNKGRMHQQCLLLFIALTGLAQNTHGQQFKVSAPLGTVPVTGFYKIPVSPQLTAYTRAGLPDVRITDGKTHVPYLLQNEAGTTTQEKFTILPILLNATDSTHTIIELECNSNEAASTLSLMMRNTAVERFTQLSGSHDRKKWYIIDDHILFASGYGSREGYFRQTINFPASKYKYYRLKIDNEHTDPLNIEKAGIYTIAGTTPMPDMAENPQPEVSVKDSTNHITYVVIKNAAAYIADKLVLNITGPKFYNRTATLFILPSLADSNDLYTPAARFQLSSAAPAVCNFSSSKALTLIVEIENNDNPPLHIKSAGTSQHQQHLIAWLEKGTSYKLLAGNINVPYPNYDLTGFKDSIPATIPVINYGPIQMVAVAQGATKKTGNNWLWPVIIISVAALSLLTFQLLKDVKRQGV